MKPAHDQTEVDLTTDNGLPEPFSVAREQAFQLARCAVELDLARQHRDKDPVGMATALNNNLEVWIALRTLTERDDCPLSDQVRGNLAQLSNFVAQKTFASPDGLSEDSFDTLININLQISEGLLEGLERSDPGQSSSGLIGIATGDPSTR